MCVCVHRGRLLPSASFTGEPWHFILERRGVPGEQGCLDQRGPWKLGHLGSPFKTSRTPQKSDEMLVEPSM